MGEICGDILTEGVEVVGGALMPDVWDVVGLSVLDLGFDNLYAIGLLIDNETDLKNWLIAVPVLIYSVGLRMYWRALRQKTVSALRNFVIQWPFLGGVRGISFRFEHPRRCMLCGDWFSSYSIVFGEHALKKHLDPSEGEVEMLFAMLRIGFEDVEDGTLGMEEWVESREGLVYLSYRVGCNFTYA